MCCITRDKPPNLLEADWSPKGRFWPTNWFRGRPPCFCQAHSFPWHGTWNVYLYKPSLETLTWFVNFSMCCLVSRRTCPHRLLHAWSCSRRLSNRWNPLPTLPRVFSFSLCWLPLSELAGVRYDLSALFERVARTIATSWPYKIRVGRHKPCFW